jgi:hypothetical protein
VRFVACLPTGMNEKTIQEIAPFSQGQILYEEKNLS